MLKSPNVLRLKEVTWFGDNVYVVTELLRGGAVLDAILRMKDERYTEAEAKLVIKRTLLGIDFMHKNFVLHRDLKLENLLLRSSEDLNGVVIADFGLARRCQRPKGMAMLPHVKGIDTAPVGTPVFAAPEVVEQRSYRWCGGHVVARRHRVRLAHGGHAEKFVEERAQVQKNHPTRLWLRLLRVGQREQRRS